MTPRKVTTESQAYLFGKNHCDRGLSETTGIPLQYWAVFIFVLVHLYKIFLLRCRCCLLFGRSYPECTCLTQIYRKETKLQPRAWICIRLPLQQLAFGELPNPLSMLLLPLPFELTRLLNSIVIFYRTFDVSLFPSQLTDMFSL